MKRFFVFVGCSLVLMLAACSPAASVTQEVSRTLRPTFAASPSNTLTSTVLPTYTSTSTPVSINTPTSTATMQSFVIEPVFPTPTTAARLSTLPPEPTHTSTPATLEMAPSETPSSTPTLACEGPTVSVELSASTASLKIGDTVKVTVTVNNEGCVALGLPQYRLYIQSDPTAILSPDRPEPIVHGLAVSPGASDSAEFDLSGVASGEATLTASVSYEVHLGYPGPAYWGMTTTRAPLIIGVTQ